MASPRLQPREARLRVSALTSCFDVFAPIMDSGRWWSIPDTEDLACVHKDIYTAEGHAAQTVQILTSVNPLGTGGGSPADVCRRRRARWHNTARPFATDR